MAMASALTLTSPSALATVWQGTQSPNWAIDSGDRKSQKGHVLLATNGAILWQSRQHSVIAMSTPIPSSLPAWRPLEIRNGYFYYRMTLTAKTYLHCQ